MPGRGRPFQKGQINNPKGRKPLPLDVVALCRSVTKEAVAKQIEIMRMDAKEDPAMLGVQTRVIDSLLNRGWGSAPQTVFVQGEISSVVIKVAGMDTSKKVLPA